MTMLTEPPAAGGATIDPRATPSEPAGPPDRGPDLRRELVRGNRSLLAGVALLALVSVAATLALPLVVGETVRAVQQTRELGGIATLLVVAGLLGAATSALATRLMSRLGERLVQRLRLRTIRHALRMRSADIDKEGVGSIAGRLGPDALHVKGAIDVLPVQLPTAVLTFGGSLVIMGFIDLPLLMTTLLGFTVGVMLVTLVVRDLRVRYGRLQENLGSLLQSFVGTMNAITLIKSTRSERAQSDRLAEETEQVRRSGVAATDSAALLVPAVTLGQQIALVTVLIGGSTRLVDGSIDLGSFVTFLLLLLQLTAPLVLAASSMSALQAGLSARQRFASLLAHTTEDDQTRTTYGDRCPAVVVHAAPAVELDDVAAGYDNDIALRGTSLVVPRSGLTALVGPSGSGKTTVLRLVERMIIAREGAVRVHGVDVRDQDLETLRSELVYVDQACTLLPGTVRENLTLGASTVLDDDELYRALAAVDLDTWVRALPDGLESALLRGRGTSGGQRQRLALARAVLSPASIVLLDEPTSALDAENENRLREVIAELASDRAVVVVAHRLSTVRSADTIVMLEDGAVHECGTHEQLLGSSPRYRELVELQLHR